MNNKKHTQFKRIFLLATGLICANLAFTSSAFAIGSIYDEGNFYSRKAEGWFWYKDPKELEEPELEEPEPETPPQVVEVKPDIEPEETQDPDKPRVFSNAWLRDAMPKYLDLAMEDPTVENVQAYMYLQRIMMDRAERFAFTTQRVVSGDPMLDETVRRPLASFAIQGVDQKAGREKSELIKKIAKDAGLFFFFASNCEECAIQAPLIKNVKDNYDFAVLPISVDGKNLPNSPFQEFKTDAGHAQLLDIKKLPALYLATADGEYELVGQSVYSLPELADRILFAASRKGLITQEQLNETRPILDSTNIDEILENADLDLNGTEKTDGLINGSANSQELMQYINSALGRSYYEN